jgi:hypothetical protein
MRIASSPSDPAPASAKKDDSVDELVKELQDILRSIPTGDGGDIYGMDTGIMWGSDDLVWNNTGSGGCGEGSDVQATEEHKVKFKRALEIADVLVAKGAGS